MRLKDEANPKMSMYKSGFKLSIGALKASGKWLTRPIQKYPRHLFSEEKYEFQGNKMLSSIPTRRLSRTCVRRKLDCAN